MRSGQPSRSPIGLAVTEPIGEELFMDQSMHGPAIERRALLQAAVLLVGGSIAGLPANALAQARGGPTFFTKAEYAVLSEVAEIILPRTDSPGAKDAGVPAALDSLMSNWA